MGSGLWIKNKERNTESLLKRALLCLLRILCPTTVSGDLRGSVQLAGWDTPLLGLGRGILESSFVSNVVRKKGEEQCIAQKKKRGKWKRWEDEGKKPRSTGGFTEFAVLALLPNPQPRP